MNIKTKLILAVTAVSLLSTPALAFRDMGDAGGASAYAIPERHSGGGMYNYGGWYRSYGYSGFPPAQIIRRRHPVQPAHRPRNYQPQR
jgi:hypothetical protein